MSADRKRRRKRSSGKRRLSGRRNNPGGWMEELNKLVEQRIQAQKEAALLELARRFRDEQGPEKVDQLGDQVGRLVFGE